MNCEYDMAKESAGIVKLRTARAWAPLQVLEVNSKLKLYYRNRGS